jgi:hypothetical protein
MALTSTLQNPEQDSTRWFRLADYTYHEVHNTRGGKRRGWLAQGATTSESVQQNMYLHHFILSSEIKTCSRVLCYFHLQPPPHDRDLLFKGSDFIFIPVKLLRDFHSSSVEYGCDVSCKDRTCEMMCPAKLVKT